jgi:poly(beta-D-mannuronate) lyase
MRRFLSLLASVCLTLGAAARDIPAKNAAELKATAAIAVGGDVIRLASGRYDDVKLRLAKNGTQGRPIQVVAAVPGEAIFGGSSEIDISGAYVVIDGLYFLNGAIAGGGTDRAVITFNSHHGVVRNTAIVDYNPTAFDTAYYWVFFNGSHNTLERCYFKGKNNLEPLIGNGLENAQHNSVVGCYFKNIPYDVGNGREDIRVWGSGKFDEKPTDGAYFTIQGNLFDHADGEGTEIVSLKSNFNQVLNNTVRATRGGLNIRRGSNNTLKGNIVLGEGVAGAHGLRMSGANHVVQGNYVSGCDYGIRVSAGEFTGYALTPDYAPKEKNNAKTAKNALGIVTAYPQSKKLALSGNVVVACDGPDLELGSDYKKHWPQEQMVLLPSDCEISGNRFVRPKGGVSVEVIAPESQFASLAAKSLANRFRSNVVVGGKLKGVAGAGFKVEDLASGWSEKRELGEWHPLTAEDVGPPWVIALRKAGNFEVEDDMSCSRDPSVKKTKKNKKAN